MWYIAQYVAVMTRSEHDGMCNAVLDEDTGMTEMDWWEIQHPYTNIIITEDDEEEEEAE